MRDRVFISYSHRDARWQEQCGRIRRWDLAQVQSINRPARPLETLSKSDCKTITEGRRRANSRLRRDRHP